MTLKAKIISILVLTALILPAFGNTAYATPTKFTIPKPKTLPGLTSEQQKTTSGEDYTAKYVIPQVVNIIIGASVILCFILLVVGGIRYLTAYGNEEALTGAKNTVVFSLVGLFIALFSYAIVALIAGIKLDKPITFVETAYAKYDQTVKSPLELMGNVPGTEDSQLKNLPFAQVPEGQDENAYITKTLYGNMAKLMLGLASILIVISFIVAGTFYVTAQGNEEQLNKAKSILIYTLIAVAIIASSYGITLGVTKIKNQVWQGGGSATESQTKQP